MRWHSSTCGVSCVGVGVCHRAGCRTFPTCPSVVISYENAPRPIVVEVMYIKYSALPKEIALHAPASALSQDVSTMANSAAPKKKREKKPRRVVASDRRASGESSPSTAYVRAQPRNQKLPARECA